MYINLMKQEQESTNEEGKQVNEPDQAVKSNSGNGTLDCKYFLNNYFKNLLIIIIVTYFP